MKQAYITLFTGWAGLQQLATTGHCQGKLHPEDKWSFEVRVPLSATDIEWDGGENDPPDIIKVDLNK